MGIHSDKKQFVSISYTKRPLFDKTVNYSPWCVFFLKKMGSKIILLIYFALCICHVVAQRIDHTCSLFEATPTSL